MSVARIGTDEEFIHEVFAEITYSEDNKDYTIVKRLVVAPLGNKKIYLLVACDPTNPTQKFQLEATSENESKMITTNCLDVITKLWPNISMTGTPMDFTNYVFNEILYKICDTHEGCKNRVQLNCSGSSFKMTFDGVEFTK
tara:strand:+ start:421 stop:843 length:423 start_codon:yes stop_codon:yes gene_type:complete